MSVAFGSASSGALSLGSPRPPRRAPRGSAAGARPVRQPTGTMADRASLGQATALAAADPPAAGLQAAELPGGRFPAGEPHAAEPHAAEPHAAEPHAAEPQAAEPQ